MVADDLHDRLISIFTAGPDGRRPCFGGTEKLQNDPAWHDNLVFNEYFHGDNGAAIGASHQTGWTGLIADMIRRRHGAVIARRRRHPRHQQGGAAMTAVAAAAGQRSPGSPFPLGATPDAAGTNFAVASGVADGMVLCLFDEAGTETQLPLRDYDAGVWHALRARRQAGQAYGYRATGPYDPARGVRCNPAKLLLDPYARAISGAVTFGPEVLGLRRRRPDVPSTLDSAATCRGAWSSTAGLQLDRRRPAPGTATRTRSSTKLHVKGFTMRHPGSRRSCAAPTPGWRTRRPSATCSTWG